MSGMAARGSVAAGHEATAAAAAAVLADGGSAFDAAISAMAAACVVEPVLASLGGGGYLLAQPRGERARIYDFFVHTPGQRLPATEQDFRPVLADFGSVTQEFHIGAASVAVPGVVAGLFAVHEDLGRMPMRDLLAPAVALARDGVTVRAFDARVLEIVAAIFGATPACRRAYASARDPDTLLRTGERLRQPELADTLDAIAAEGQALFYRGEIAARIAGCVGAGGHLRRQDLERYAVRRARALAIEHHGVEIACNPPPASGGVLVAFTLALLRAAGIGALEPGSAAAVGALARSMALTGEARARAQLAGGGQLDESLLDPAFLRVYRQRIAAHPAARGGTTQVSIVDARGNAASASLSNGESAGLLVPGTGILLNNMLGEQDLNPGGLDRWPAATRMSSMMAPSIGRRRDGGLIITGSGGSNRIRSAIVQVLVNLIDHGMDVHAAVAAPRVHLEDGRLSVEAGIDAQAIATVLRAYPDHHLWDETSMFFGGAHTVVADADGATRGAGDPRRGGVCLGG